MFLVAKLEAKKAVVQTGPTGEHELMMERYGKSVADSMRRFYPKNQKMPKVSYDHIFVFCISII